MLSTSPSFFAKAVGPPAASMTRLDSSGLIPPCKGQLNSSQAVLYLFSKESSYRPAVATDYQIMKYAFEVAETRGVSNVDIAEACSCTRQAVSNWKIEKVIPPGKYVGVAKALGITVDGLLSLGENEPLLSVSERQIQALSEETRTLVVQAMHFIRTAINNTKQKGGERLDAYVEASRAPLQQRRN